MKVELHSALAVVEGDADGRVLFGNGPISFWGGVDAATGCVIDRRHNLYGACLTGAVLVIPRGAGSCSTSAARRSPR